MAFVLALTAVVVFAIFIARPKKQRKPEITPSTVRELHAAARALFRGPDQERLWKMLVSSAGATYGLASEFGATGNPTDYVRHLTFIPPAAHGECVILVCGCCGGPMMLDPQIGSWMSKNRKGVGCWLCGICIDFLSKKRHELKTPEGYDPLSTEFVKAGVQFSPFTMAAVRTALMQYRAEESALHP
jgi:hypothetical protein